MRHRFVASALYFSKTNLHNRFAQRLANGWNVSGTVTEQTGFPITAFMANSAPSGIYTTGAGTTAIAAPMDGAATGGGDNTANAPASAFGRAPQVSRNAYKGPGLNNVDMRISRDFAIAERYRFQLLGEAFNIANHRNNLSVANLAYAFVAPSATSAACPAASHTATCIVPYTSFTSTTTPVGTPNSTSSTLYGPRQLQFAVKLFF